MHQSMYPGRRLGQEMIKVRTENEKIRGEKRTVEELGHCAASHLYISFHLASVQSPADKMHNPIGGGRALIQPTKPLFATLSILEAAL